MVYAPPSGNEMILNKNTSLMVVNTSNVVKSVVLTSSDPPPYDTIQARLLSIKATPSRGEITLDSFDILCSTGTSFKGNPLNFTEKTGLQVYSCINLMEYPTNVFNIVNYYMGTFTNYVTGPDPGTTVVNVGPENTILFADLRSVSKVFVLPSIDSITSSATESPCFTFKDAYGNVGFNTWYISSTGGDTFENLGTTLRFESPNLAIQLAGQVRQGGNRWHILGGYGV